MGNMKRTRIAIDDEVTTAPAGPVAREGPAGGEGRIRRRWLPNHALQEHEQS